MNRSCLPPLIAVITPTFRRIAQLRRAMRSVQNQTYPSIEHIIVGDNCPDLDREKPILLAEFPNAFIVNARRHVGYIGKVQDAGAHLRYIGFYFTEADHIAYLDDDNYYLPNHISSCLEAFDHETQWTFSYQIDRMSNEDGRHEKRRFDPKHTKPYAARGGRPGPLIDSSCFFIPKVCLYTVNWDAEALHRERDLHDDRHFTERMIAAFPHYRTTGKYTVVRDNWR